MMGANTWEWLFSISNKEIFQKKKKKRTHSNTHIRNKVSKGVANGKNGETNDGIREPKDQTKGLGTV